MPVIRHKSLLEQSIKTALDGTLPEVQNHLQIYPRPILETTINSLSGAIDDRVKKAGDTMTGTLAMSGAAIDLDIAFTPAWKEGRVFYDTDTKTLSYYNDNSEVTINVGQEQVIRVRNNTGSTIANGKVVCISGALGNHPLVVLASNNSHGSSHRTLGVVTHQLNDNENGYATVLGIVNGLDTSGYSAEGVPLWLGTNGDITETEPVSPTHKVKIGYVVRKHITQGSILVHIDTSSDLGDLHDVNISSPQNGDIIKYNSTNTRWENSSLTGSISASLSLYTPLTTTAAISSNLQNAINTLDSQVVKLTGNQTVHGQKTFTGETVFNNNVYINGTQFIVNTQTISASDNVIEINAGEVGPGVTRGFAGLRVDRGSANDFMFAFDEVRDRFVVGTVTSETSGQVATLQVVATREDNPLSNGYARYNSSLNRFDTVTGATITGASQPIDPALTDISNASYPAPVPPTGFSTVLGDNGGIVDWVNVPGTGYLSSNYVNLSDYEDQDVIDKVKNVDGAGSGLDADLLDGQEGSYYAADSMAVKISGDQNIAGFKVFLNNLTVSSSTGRVLLGDDAGGSVSIGRQNGNRSTPYIDFNSGLNLDYDVRMIATSGANSVGGGDLNIFARNLNFNGSPLILNSTVASLTGQLLSNINTRALANDAVSISGDDTITGTKFFTQETHFDTNGNAIRIYGSNDAYGTILRADSTDFYILQTISGDKTGTWSTRRPFRINNATGDLYLGNHAGSPTGKVYFDVTSVDSSGNADATITFDGDSDTGISRLGTNQLNIIAGGRRSVDLGQSGITMYRGSGASAPVQNDFIASLNAGSFDGSSMYNTAGRVRFYASENWTPTSRGTGMQLRVTSNGTASSEWVALTIDGDNGVVQAGNISVPAAGSQMWTSSEGVKPNLQAFNNNANGSSIGIGRFTNDGTAGRLIFVKSRNATPGDISGAIQNGNSIGDIVFEASDGSQLLRAARIVSTSSATPSAGNVPGNIQFHTRNVGGTLAERVRISDNGILTIDGTATTPSHSFLTDPDTGMYSDAANTLEFSTAGIERMKLDSAGRMIVSHTAAITGYFNGADTPQVQIHTPVPLAVSRWSNDAFCNVISIGKSRGATPGSHTVVQNDDDLGIISFQGSNGANFRRGAEIVAEVDGTAAGINMPARLGIWTYSPAVSGMVEGLRVNSSQQILSATGTVGAPSHSFLNDTNTGIYSSGADTVSVATSGVLRAEFNNSGFRFISGSVPATSGATGSVGQLAYDSSFLYVCVAANSWRRASLSTW